MLVVEAPHGEVRGRDAAVTVAEAHGEVPGRAADIGLKLVEVLSGEVLDPHGEVPGRAADGGLKLPMEVPHGEVPGRGAVSLAARTSALIPYDMAKKKAETDSAKFGRAVLAGDGKQQAAGSFSPKSGIFGSTPVYIKPTRHSTPSEPSPSHPRRSPS